MKNLLSITLLLAAPIVVSCSATPKQELTETAIAEVSSDNSVSETITTSATLSESTNTSAEEEVTVVEVEETNTSADETKNTGVKEVVEKEMVKEVVLDKAKMVKIEKEDIKSTAKEEVQEVVEEVEVEESEEAPEEIVVAPDHSAWNALTSKYVTSKGNVNYDGLKGQQSKIKAYIKSLQDLPPAASWSKNEKLAYWINLYNALTVNLILDNYPLKSIMEINGGKAWDLKVIKIAGKDYSLNDIEHGTIRKQFKEPRIHFAVNCAAASCPRLLNAAFLPNKLDQQLEALAVSFINNSAKNKISGSATQLSQIFNWYGSDFGDVKSYVKKYHKSFSDSAPVTYLEYDWKLNK